MARSRGNATRGDSRPCSSAGRAAIAAVPALLLWSSLLTAQTDSTLGVTPLPSAQQVIQRNTDPFAGSLTQGKAASGVIDLTAQEALDRALKYNLGLYLSDRTTDEARAARLRTLSELLPNVSGSLTEQVQRVNLKAFGFKFPGFPSSVGPFGLVDTRATGSWDMIDFSRFDNLRASNESIKAAQFSYRDARDTVVLAVAANYLLTIAYESRVAATETEVRTAQALYQLAVDQENAGLAPNIDTLRARVQLQTQQQALIQAQNGLDKQRIALARVIGLPAQQKFRLVDRVPYHPVPEPELANVYDRALQTRSDYLAAAAQLRSAKLSREAAWKERLPSLGLSGEYGVLGYTPSSLAPNYTAAASIKVPIFQGGKVRSDIQQAEAVLKQRQAQVDDLKSRIEQDIQNAILDLKAAAQQVDVATTGLTYAQQALTQSQDRFSAGVTNNVEVIQAQQALATANDQYITSLYAHNIAKVLLSRAIGNAEQAVKLYLADQGQSAAPSGTPQGANAPAVPVAAPAGTTTNVEPATPATNVNQNPGAQTPTTTPGAETNPPAPAAPPR